MNLKQLADKYIPASQGKKTLKREGDTQDIIAEVLAAYKDSRKQLTEFAPHLQGATLQQTLYNIWAFWKSNIIYKVDPPGKQYIKEPKALWKTKTGDCKSLSLAVMATLDALDIKAAFRFTSYDGNNTFPTHVYVVVKNGSEIIPVDCVWTHYGSQKKFTKNWDYMTSIYRVAGLGMMPVNGRRRKMPKRGVLHLPINNPKITPAICDMLLKKQRLELEQQIHTSANGIGTTYDRAYEMQIAAIHNALAETMDYPRVTIAGFENSINPDQRNDHAESGIGYITMGKEAATVAAIEGFFDKVFKGVKKVGKAVGKGVKKVGKTYGKVAKAVGKGIAKGAKAIKNVAQKALTGAARNAILDSLPKVAPMFLYTFITDQKILAKLPAAVAAKREKGLYYKKIIIKKLLITDSNFTGAVRNGIMQTFQLSPEALIAKWLKDTNYKIGVIPPQAIKAAIEIGIKALKGLAKMILGDVGANIERDAETFAPLPEDWGTVTAEAAAELAAEITNQPANLQPKTEEQLYNSFPSPPAARQTDDSSGGNDASTDASTGEEGFKENGTGVQRPQNMDPVIIEQPKSNNSGLLIGLAAVGLFLTMKK